MPDSRIIAITVACVCTKFFPNMACTRVDIHHIRPAITKLTIVFITKLYNRIARKIDFSSSECLPTSLENAWEVLMIPTNVFPNKWPITIGNMIIGPLPCQITYRRYMKKLPIKKFVRKYTTLCAHANTSFAYFDGDNISPIKKATCADPRVKNNSNVEIVASRKWCFRISVSRRKSGQMA